MCVYSVCLQMEGEGFFYTRQIIWELESVSEKMFLKDNFFLEGEFVINEAGFQQ